MKKIGIYLDDFSLLGGVEKVTFDLICLLKDKYIINIYSRYQKNDNPIYPFKSIANVFVLQNNIDEDDYITSLLKRLKRDNINKLIIQLQNLDENKKLISEVKNRSNIEVISVLHSSPYAYLNFFKLRGDNRIIAFFRKIKFYLYWKPLNYKALKQIIEISSFFLCVSKTAFEEIQDCFEIKELSKINYIYNFIQNKDTFINNDYSQKQNTIVYGGRLSKDKQVHLLIEVWNDIFFDFYDWNFEIYGNGDEYNYLNNQIKQKKVRNIEMKGIVSDMGPILEKSKICILFSLFEGFPTILYEASIHNNVLISSNSYGGSKDIIKHNMNGFIINEKNELKEKLKEILNDQIRLKEMGESNEKYRDNFSEELIKDKWISILK
ncbi:TPA: glycosyltransferase [Elizabethkingia anophelis]